MLLNSISRKVLVGYAAIVLIVAVVSSILFSGLSRINDATDEFAAKSLPAVQSINKIKKSINQTLIMAYGLYGYTIERQDFESNVSEELNHLTAEVKQLASFFRQADAVKLDILSDRLAVFKDIMTASEVDWDAARESLGQIQAEVSQIESIVSANEVVITQLANAKTLEIDEDVNAMLFWLTVSVVLIIVITVAAYLLAKKQIALPISSLSEQLDYVVEHNDLSRQVSIACEDEVGLTAASVNKLLTTFRKVNLDIGQSAAVVKEAINVLNQSASLSDSEVEKLSDGIAIMSQSAEQLEHNIRDAAHRSELASNTALTGATQVEDGTTNISQTSKIISDLSSDIDHSAEMLLSLKNAGDKVSDVVKTIADIADQTNLLALNAAIEAARAGESGRGFAVVAGEVRTLASRTHDSTFEINSILAEIVNSISSTVSLMEVNKSKANDAVSAAETTVESLKVIQQTVKALSVENHDLAEAAQSNQTDLNQMKLELANIHRGMGVVASSSSETKNAATTLNKLSLELEQSAKQFKV